jgi:hypothetical protein
MGKKLFTIKYITSSRQFSSIISKHFPATTDMIIVDDNANISPAGNDGPTKEHCTGYNGETIYIIKKTNM